MNLEEFRAHCIKKKGVVESFPFDNETLVFKVLTKMFALTSLSATEFRFNVKCDPELIESVRAKYAAVQPGYHQNKNHWNTVYVDGSISNKELMLMIDQSYDLVIKGLSKKERMQLDNL